MKYKRQGCTSKDSIHCFVMIHCSFLDWILYSSPYSNFFEAIQKNFATFIRTTIEQIGEQLMLQNGIIVN